MGGAGAKRSPPGGYSLPPYSCTKKRMTASQSTEWSSFMIVVRRLLEQLLREDGQVDAPVAPDVATVGLVVLAGVAVRFAIILEDQ